MKTVDANGMETTEVAQFLRDAGLIAAGEEAVFTPLTGGVAADIWKVQTATRTIAVKRALEKLRVAREWIVPTSRNASEVEWLRAARAIVPNAVPRILAHDPDVGAFAMDYLDPADHPVWKAELAAGRADPLFAAQVGTTIGTIHAATAHDDAMAKRFANDALFHAIRLEPYLEATAASHPALAPKLMALSRDTLAGKIALVHGDVSPKNILVGPRGPVILDAECAWYGDPAFDVAFCLNHMLLKCVWTPRAAADFLSCFDALSDAYRACITWEGADVLEARAAALLPGMLLGRIDGKSPVEYITNDSDKSRVRAIACHFIDKTPTRLSDIRNAWAREFVTT